MRTIATFVALVLMAMFTFSLVSSSAPPATVLDVERMSRDVTNVSAASPRLERHNQAPPKRPASERDRNSFIALMMMLGAGGRR